MAVHVTVKTMRVLLSLLGSIESACCVVLWLCFRVCEGWRRLWFESIYQVLIFFFYSQHEGRDRLCREQSSTSMQFHENLKAHVLRRLLLLHTSSQDAVHPTLTKINCTYQIEAAPLLLL